jgi:hypothetical protein
MNEKTQSLTPEQKNMDILDIPVHPAADAFPMMEEELEELAANIKANGLQQPLVVAEIEGQMMLIDGRTRRMACLALGIVPTYVVLDGQDPVTYILSANIHWRHMSKGQRVMIVAKICSETKQTLRQISEQNKVALAATGRARTVLHHALDLAAFQLIPSPLCKRGSSFLLPGAAVGKGSWIPAFAGMTCEG